MFNRIYLLGRLGKDPDLRSTKTGKEVATFSLATDSWTEKEKRTEWHNIVVWGKQAVACKNALKKGSKALVEGTLQTKVWEDKQGQKRESKEVVATTVVFLDGKDSVPADHSETTFSANPMEYASTDVYADIPF